jgi:predicted transcriptional regulator
MDPTPPLDDRLAAVQSLAGTPVRLRVLDALADGPLSRPRLSEAVDAPRTTLHRNLETLADHHWVTHDPTTDEYSLTPAGRLARRGLREALDPLDTARRAGRFLRECAADLPVTADDLAAMTVVTATESDPHRPVSWLHSHVAETDRLRAVVPAAGPANVVPLADFVAEGLTLELVVGEGFLDPVRREFGDRLAALRRAETATVAVLPDPPAFGLALLPAYVFVVAYDDRLRSHSIARLPRADGELTAWATDRFERLADAAAPPETD